MAGSPSVAGDLDLEAAFAASGRDHLASGEFAQKAISPGISNDQLERLVTFLLQFRLENAEGADRLFLQLLTALAAEVAPQPNRILLIANYLFGSRLFGSPELLRGNIPPEAVEHLLRSGGGITYTTVGGVATYDLSVVRPGVSPESIRPYLEVALQVLSYPDTDPQRRVQAYVGAWQLLPKAQEFAPDLAPGFVHVMQRLAESMPPAVKDKNSYSVLGRTTLPSRADRLAEYEKTRDPARREEMQISFFNSHWQRNEFAEARKWARKVEDEMTRAQLLSLADFGEAMQALQGGDLDSARAIVRQMQRGVRAALVSIGIAVEYARTGYDREAWSWLLEAQRQAGFVSPRLRTHLLFGIAGEMAALDTDAALAALEQAVQAMNDGDEAEPRRAEVTGDDPWSRRMRILSPPEGANDWNVEFRPEGFREYVHAGRMPRSFWLRGKTLPPLDVVSAIRKFSRAPERAEAILLRLESEEHLSRALPALAAAYLDWGRKEE